jgi:hypothetical protein
MRCTYETQYRSLCILLNPGSTKSLVVTACCNHQFIIFDFILPCGLVFNLSSSISLLLLHHGVAASEDGCGCWDPGNHLALEVDILSPCMVEVDVRL